MNSVAAFFEKYTGTIDSGWIIVSLTDEYYIEQWNSRTIPSIITKMTARQGKILEIRLFNDDMEHRLSRSDIGQGSFHVRSIYDTGKSRDRRDHYDQLQYLDIDETKNCKDGFVQTTGGGRYHMPLNNIHDARIRIRYYLERYPDTGQARIADWRLVAFVEE